MMNTLELDQCGGVRQSLEYWPDSIRNNPRREKDLPRLTVPLFGPVGPAYVEDENDCDGTAD